MKLYYTCMAAVVVADAAANDIDTTCRVVPYGDFCLCATDADCTGTCVEFRHDPDELQNGICITAAEQNDGKRDPCDRSQNDPYQIGDCVLQSRRENPQFACDGAYYNLDLYVRSNRPGDNSFRHSPKECVIGYNLLRVAGQTVAQCQQLCLDYPGQRCVAVEFGVDYGGAGLSTAEHTGCGALGTTTPGAGATPAPPPTPPAPTPPLLPDFAPCTYAVECASGGCFHLAGTRRRALRRVSQSGKSQRSSYAGGTCANPASFRESGPDSVCQFPFVFRGQTFTTCITDGDAAGRPWCSTMVDVSDGRKHVSGGGFIHYCATPAPTPAPTLPSTPLVPNPPQVVYVTSPPTPAPPPPAPVNPIIIPGGGGWGTGGGCFGFGGAGCGFGMVCCNGVCCGIGQYCSSGIGFGNFCRNRNIFDIGI